MPFPFASVWIRYLDPLSLSYSLELGADASG